MYKQLMTLLMVATFACGFAFAEDEIETVKPEAVKTEEATLAGCGCNKKPKQEVETQIQEAEDAAFAARCGCGKSNCGCTKLCNGETEVRSDEIIIEESETGEALVVDDSASEDEVKEEVKTA